MVRHRPKILQHLIQDFLSVPDHFGLVCITGRVKQLLPLSLIFATFIHSHGKTIWIWAIYWPKNQQVLCLTNLDSRYQPPGKNHHNHLILQGMVFMKPGRQATLKELPHLIIICKAPMASSLWRCFLHKGYKFMPIKLVFTNFGHQGAIEKLPVWHCMKSAFSEI